MPGTSMTGLFGLSLIDFAGKWILLRKIDDTGAGRVGNFSGIAEFTPIKDGLNYVETGELTLAGQSPVSASRCYVWRQDEGRILVDFEDYRPFHHFATDQRISLATHDCPPDIYQVRYDFTQWPEWSARWQVNGPRKDYCMVSHYRR